MGALPTVLSLSVIAEPHTGGLGPRRALEPPKKKLHTTYDQKCYEYLRKKEFVCKAKKTIVGRC